ncbi:MAG: nucleoside triphosphate pyrophosphohydrolase [Anaerolineaceae bacterium]
MSNLDIINYTLELSKNHLTVIPFIDLKDKYYPPFFSNQNILVIDLPEADKGDVLYQLLTKILPAEHPIMIFEQSKEPKKNYHLETYPFNAEIKNKITQEILAIYIPANKLKNSMLDFQELIAHLRAPEGCPWDREQTHESLRPNLLEETYEVLHTIDEGDLKGMQEELGDLLLQIILHAQISSENEDFNLEDVVTGIEQKLIFRHPHIFGDKAVSGADEVIKNWEVLKAQERKDNHKAQGILRSVPKNMAALSLAQAYQKRAARVGFDWETIEPVKQKVAEEIREVEDAVDDIERAKELGDVLFAIVNLIRWYGCDAESVLREAAERFADRFQYIEECVQKRGKTFADFSLAELDTFWEEAKKKQSSVMKEE